MPNGFFHFCSSRTSLQYIEGFQGSWRSSRSGFYILVIQMLFLTLELAFSFRLCGAKSTGVTTHDQDMFCIVYCIVLSFFKIFFKHVYHVSCFPLPRRHQWLRSWKSMAARQSISSRLGRRALFTRGVIDCNWGAAGAIGAAGWSSRFATARMEAPSLICWLPNLSELNAASGSLSIGGEKKTRFGSRQHGTHLNPSGKSLESWPTNSTHFFELFQAFFASDKQKHTLAVNALWVSCRATIGTKMYQGYARKSNVYCSEIRSCIAA